MKEKLHIKNLCVLRLTALGDCINAFGVINAIHEQYPDIKIKWIIDKRFTGLFRNDQGDDIIPMLPVSFKEGGLLKNLLKLRPMLADLSFDCLFNLQTSIKASLVSLMIKSKLKLGYDKQRGREGQKFFIDRQVPSPTNPHVIAGFMAFAKYSGLAVEKPIWDFKFSDAELTYAKTSLLGRYSDSKIFAIAPASAKQAKNWTVAGYAALAAHALKAGFSIILLGSNNQVEIKLCQEIAAKIANQCLNLCGKTNLRALGCIIKQASLVLSPDSAIMHLSSALNIPVIGLFAIHDPDRVGPWNYQDLRVSVYKELARDELHSDNIPWRYRVHDEKAMLSIKQSDVIAAFDKALLSIK